MDRDKQWTFRCLLFQFDGGSGLPFAGPEAATFTFTANTGTFPLTAGFTASVTSGNLNQLVFTSAVVNFLNQTNWCPGFFHSSGGSVK